MLRLVYKDIRLQRNTMLIMLPFLFLFLYEETSIIYVSILFCIALIMNAFAVDEKASINLLLNSLPYTRKEIVISKYISACLFTAIVLMTIMMGSWIIHGESIPLIQLVLISSFVVIFIAAAFPLSYLLNSQYLLIAGIITFVVYLFIANMFIPDLNDRIRNLTQSILSYDHTQLYIYVLLVSGILSILSFLISMRIYSRKVF
ncbi:ABC-2 transporter permease [Pradoshia eiseniae]|uniref:ABC-2 transporter permease n=1 Tax=Pradoshia eiseniae TaxID=2064768 RepID=A0A2S7MXM2_9BACI|nr:ABC-2 transporter permease [Pradoshia eiseniae]PQD94529.1 ABC-2 transporter permease [Pradoshia eiseniae]